jgi:dipeptidyl aminopeptidase/acylaminoacyl peptidase
LAATRHDSPCWHANAKTCVIPAGGGEISIVSGAFDESTFVQDWGPQGIYSFAARGTTAHLFRFDPATGEHEQITPSDREGWISMGCSFDRTFLRAGVVAGDAAHYLEAGVLDMGSRTFQPLSDFNSHLEGRSIARRETISWTSKDGTEINGVLMKPPGFEPNAKHPLLVVIHGGPGGVSFQALISRQERLYYPIQQWLAMGALVLEPNYRGSAGYGEVFRSLNVRNLGIGDYDDVISGVETLTQRGWIDPERVGVMGWSQGGFISAFIATYGGRIRAASVGAGVSNWTTYYANTDVHSLAYQYHQATPWEDPESYRRSSPMTYIHNAKIPTLILHGDCDRRVPIPNAFELYQGLKDLGVPTKLVVYPGMGHPINSPRTSRHVMHENLDWFGRWIWDETPDDGPAAAD